MVINIENKNSKVNAQSSWQDVLALNEQLSSDEQITQSSVRAFCEDKLMPRIINDNRNEHFSREILYEMGDPECYISPDVCVDFTRLAHIY